MSHTPRVQPPAATSVPLPRPRALRAAVVAVAEASEVVVEPAVVVAARAVAGIAAVVAVAVSSVVVAPAVAVVAAGGADGYPRPGG